MNGDQPNLTPSGPVKSYARNQKCGCIVCICEDEVQCHGCGATHCGTHPLGQIPDPIYEEPDPAPPQPAPEPASMGNPIDLNPAPDRSEASRKAFEADLNPNILSSHPNGYHNLTIHLMWNTLKRAPDHAAQEQPYYIDKRQTCPACGLPHTGDHRCMTQEQPAPDGSAVEWLDRDGREWPLPIHAQRIVFEGCDSVTMPPEAYLALYHDALALAQRCDAAEGQVKYYARSVITLSGQFDKAEAKLADAERRVERLYRAAADLTAHLMVSRLEQEETWRIHQLKTKHVIAMQDALAETKEDAR